MKEKFSWIKPMLYVLLPMAVFIILYDVWTALLQYVLGLFSGLFGTAGALEFMENMGNFQALCIMGGLLLSFLCLFKLAHTDGFLTPGKEVWKIPAWQYVLLTAGTVAVTYGLNYLFTVTGFMGSSESYQQVAENQYNVAVGMGLVLYGVVSPFVEEVVGCREF